MSIEVNDESGEGVDGERVSALARFVLDALKVHPQAELSVLAVDVATMSSLHEQWMDEEGPTDVLSFPVDESGPAHGQRELGDVVICPEHTEDLLEAVVHGVLHLTGMDHETDDGEMLALQAEILSW